MVVEGGGGSGVGGRCWGSGQRCVGEEENKGRRRRKEGIRRDEKREGREREGRKEGRKGSTQDERSKLELEGRAGSEGESKGGRERHDG